MGINDQQTPARQFHEGLCLAAGGEYLRARAAFLDCVLADPGRGDFVREFLASLNRCGATDAHRGAMPPKDACQAIEQAAAQGNWAEVLRSGPRLLAEHPGHVATLMQLASACAAQGFGSAEAAWLSAAAEAAGNDCRVQRRAGQAFARLARYDEALACWKRVEAGEPDDEEAAQMLVTLTIAKSRQQAGLPGVELPDRSLTNDSARRPPEPVTRFVVSSASVLRPSAAQPAGLTLSPLQELEAAIRERPSIAELYLRLAQFYLDKDRDYDAERLLAKGRDATDRDPRVQQMWEEVTMLRQGRRVEIARQEVKTADTPQTRDALQQATKERARVELEIFQGRCKREPQSACNQYELGLRLLRAEKTRDAGPHFEKALADSGQRGPAALRLGECQEQLGEYSHALAHYRMAAEAALPSEQIEERKEALYRAGKLAMRMKLTRLAQRYLAQLLRLDPNHRDAAMLMQGT